MATKNPPQNGQVYSIRFSKDELVRLRIMASNRKRKLSDVVHEAIDLYTSASRFPRVDISVPSDSKVTIFQSKADGGETVSIGKYENIGDSRSST